MAATAVCSWRLESLFVQGIYIQSGKYCSDANCGTKNEGGMELLSIFIPLHCI
jgi:hypothetical protein